MISLTNHKKTIAVILLAGIPIVFANFTTKYIKTTGAHAGSTGAPGDLTCAQSGCHANATVNNNSVGVNTFTYPVADSSYVPGQTYTLSLKVKKAGILKFGFEIQPLIDANNTNAGTWTVTDATHTHEITHTIASNSRHSITHTTAGTVPTATGEDVWTFKWKAPSTNVGKITFYYCTNCTNNNDANTGDALYLNSFKIHPAKITGISEFVDEQDSKIYFNTSSSEVVFDYALKTDEKVAFRLVDALGRVVYDQQANSKLAGKNTERMAIDNNIRKGIYFATLIVDEHMMTEKILVQ
jgi:hypothetical protein